MRELLLPYGKEVLKAEIEEEYLASALVLELHDYKAPMKESRLVQETLKHPIGTPRLCDMAVDKKKVVIISPDHTRSMFNHTITSPTLKEICGGNPDAEITIFISTGLHRETTREELGSKSDPEIVENETIIAHDCGDADNAVCLNRLPPGRNLYANKLAVEVDLLVVEGFIEPHFFTGFLGGRKSVLPDVTSRETVMYNHNSTSIDDPHSRTGITKGNPIHDDMLYVTRMVGLDFIVDVVIDFAHEPIFAVAGDCDLVHRVGREFPVSKCQVDAVSADIVIPTNGGYSPDQDIYQSVKGMAAARVTVKEGGAIAMLFKVADGRGGKYLHETLRDEKDLSRMMKTFTDRKPGEAIIGQWQPQVSARVTLKARIAFVSFCDDRLMEELHMIPIRTMEEALKKVKAVVDREDYKVTIIPDRVPVIVRG